MSKGARGEATEGDRDQSLSVGTSHASPLRNTPTRAARLRVRQQGLASAVRREPEAKAITPR